MRPLNLETVRQCLEAQVGRDQALKASEIVETVTGQRSTPDQERRVRAFAKTLRLEGHPVCSHSSFGYYWAQNPGDIDAACEWLRGKALSSLGQITRLRRLALPPVAGQLTLLGGPPPAPTPRPTVALAVELPEELYQAAAELAAAQGSTVEALLISAARAWLEDEKHDA